MPQGGVDPDVVAARNRRHLDQLEVNLKPISVRHTLIPASFQRSNYGETRTVADEDAGNSSRGARSLISEKRSVKMLGTSPAATKKKSTMAVRTALLYPKSLATLIEESVGRAVLP